MRKIKNDPSTAKAVMADRGFTLVELLVVFTILTVMAVVMAGILNPIALVNKAQDSRRKNDLKEIKIAFEKYYTDKGTYPSAIDVSTWNIADNCGKTVLAVQSYFKKWPCGPNNQLYEFSIIDRDTYKVVTKLDNRTDKHIPIKWYEADTYSAYAGRKEEVNYGVSSSNILWYENDIINPTCSGLDCIQTVDGANPHLIIDGVCVTGGNIQCYRSDAQAGCEVAFCCNGSGCP